MWGKDESSKATNLEAKKVGGEGVGLVARQFGLLLEHHRLSAWKHSIDLKLFGAWRHKRKPWHLDWLRIVIRWIFFYTSVS